MKSINPHVIPATIDHCYEMSKHIREIDRREVWASGGFWPRDALEYSVKSSTESFTVITPNNKVPILMFGIGPEQTILDKKRQIWMLATDEINDISFKFLRNCAQYIHLIGSGSTVYNYVIEGNDKTLKWLHWLGFTILEAKPHGLIGQKFHYVEKDIPSCAHLLQRH